MPPVTPQHAEQRQSSAGHRICQRVQTACFALLYHRGTAAPLVRDVSTPSTICLPSFLCCRRSPYSQSPAAKCSSPLPSACACSQHLRCRWRARSLYPLQITPTPQVRHCCVFHSLQNTSSVFERDVRAIELLCAPPRYVHARALYSFRGLRFGVADTSANMKPFFH